MAEKKLNIIAYEGTLLTQYVIFITNIILIILTLGLYLPYAQNRMRKYKISSFSLLNERFEYEGAGGALSGRYFKNLLLISFFSIIIALISDASTSLLLQAGLDLGSSSPLRIGMEFDSDLKYAFEREFGKTLGFDISISQLIFRFSFFIIYAMPIFIILYGGSRYKYSKIKWRGCHGSLSGSATKYGFLAFSRIILNIISLGYLIPESQLKNLNYKIDNSNFGGVGASFNYASNHNLSIINIITLLLFIPSLGLSRFWYKAALLNYKYNHTQIGSLHLSSNYKGGELCLMFLSNMAILIFTAGLGLPIITNRNLRLFARNVAIKGDIDEQFPMDDISKHKGSGFNAELDIDPDDMI